MAEHNVLGKKGEDIAIRHFSKNGYKILETNWHFGKIEIDIIAKKDDLLVVAEVKTRQTNYFGEPEIFVTRKKQRNIIKATDAYLKLKEIDLEVRFDIISILLNNKKHQLEHFEDAFNPLV